MYSHCSYFPDLFRPNTSQVIDLVGYWQSYKHFINHTNQIKNQLQFKKNVLKPARRFLTKTIQNNISNVVGIHIRRGDFIGQRKVSSDKFIFDGMNYFIRKYHSVNFIIVSDDKPYCQKTFGKRNDTFITPDSFTAPEDMAILTLCDHIIITVGTYGWWGAFLLHNRTGEVITDSKPDHSALDVDCAASVFFPPWFKFLNKTN
jgi:galactoside 2-L-fucosyltransferase 1/2